MDFSKGYLSNLLAFSSGNGELPTEDYNYWDGNFKGFKAKLMENMEDAIKKGRDFSQWDWDWTAFDLADFLSKLRFEKVSEDHLDQKTTRLIIDDYQISAGNEKQYIRSLNWFVLENSHRRAKITQKDLITLIESTKEEIAKGPINPAVQGRWLEPVKFDVPSGVDASSYFEGKAARPFHIGAGLPVQRKSLEEEALRTLNDSDALIIRASSGHIKQSLVAWPV